MQQLKKGITYKFYQSRNNKRPEKPSFIICSNPKKYQPGNGKVLFVHLRDQSYEGYTHRDLKDVYRHRDFPQLRARCLNDNLGGVKENAVVAANVLLSFEIARRLDELEEA